MEIKHNKLIPLIEGGWHKNFKDPINRSWDMNKTKIQNGVFLHTLYIGKKRIGKDSKYERCWFLFTLPI